MKNTKRRAVAGLIVILTGPLLAAAPAGKSGLPVAADRKIRPAVIHGQTQPSAHVDVPSVETGQIAAVLVHEGQAVKKGQIIAQLDDRIQELAVKLGKEEAGSDVAIQAAKNQVTETHSAYKRVEAMGNNVSESEVLDKKLAYQQALLAVQEAVEKQQEEKIKLATAQAILDRMTIRSPLNGSVLHIAKHAGEAVLVDATVATIVRTSQLNVVFFPPGRLFGKIRVGDKLPILIRSVPPVTREATVITVDPIINPASQLFRVKMQFNNRKQTIAAGTAALWKWPGQ